MASPEQNFDSRSIPGVWRRAGVPAPLSLLRVADASVVLAGPPLLTNDGPGWPGRGQSSFSASAIGCATLGVRRSSAMELMKAVRIDEYGGSEVLVYEDAPRPEPDPDDLLVRV